jgi:hypothetical protein
LKSRRVELTVQLDGGIDMNGNIHEGRKTTILNGSIRERSLRDRKSIKLSTPGESDNPTDSSPSSSTRARDIGIYTSPQINREKGSSGVIYLGIDPGASGGLAVIDGKTVSLSSMPDTERDLWNWFNSNRLWAKTNYKEIFGLIEKVGGYIKGNATPGSAMFNFGVSYGRLRMCLVGNGIPFEEITPQRWQKELAIPTRSTGKNGKAEESKVEFKRRLKQKAENLYPLVSLTLATCDALLIATVAKRRGG